MIPKRFIGENIIHLPTVKTHVFTTTTGAMKNAFGGLLNEHRHWTHPVIHETLVDLLMIQKKIHRGVFAVMDGTFAGDGPGPRCMVPHVKNVILASADQVAIDAVAAKLMGFDPHVDQVHPPGPRARASAAATRATSRSSATSTRPKENWHFDGPFKKMTFAVADAAQDLLGAAARSRSSGRSRPCSRRGPTSRASIYHDIFWYPVQRASARCERRSTARGAGCSRTGSS